MVVFRIYGLLRIRVVVGISLVSYANKLYKLNSGRKQENEVWKHIECATATGRSKCKISVCGDYILTAYIVAYASRLRIVQESYI